MNLFTFTNLPARRRLAIVSLAIFNLETLRDCYEARADYERSETYEMRKNALAHYAFDLRNQIEARA